MSKRDTLKTSKRSVQAQEMSLDIPPHNSIKKNKAKERQVGRKEAKKIESWYCECCAVEVYQYRCKHCGKSELEEF